MERILDSHDFHKLWVIESLEDGDLKTGTRLVEDRLFIARLRHKHLEVEHRRPTSKTELIKELETIRDEALYQGLYPLIHFDCHGDPNRLQTTNADHITWEELRRLLIQINHACRCNLMIVIAACNGINLIKCCTKLDRAPFYAAIGPETKVKAGKIERDFQTFYSKLFEDLDGDAALRALNGGKEGPERTYHFISSAGIFARAYRKYCDDTPSGRIEIFFETIAGFSYDDCLGHPAWFEPAEWLGSDKAQRYPLHLLTTQLSTRLHAQMDMGCVSQASKVAGREPIRINLADAAARGICNGDVVRVFNDRGAILAGAVVTEALRSGVVQISTGAWYDPEHPGVAGSLEKHGNPNVLTLDKGTSRLAQGPSAQSALVEVEKYAGLSPAVSAFDPPLKGPLTP